MAGIAEAIGESVGRGYGIPRVAGRRQVSQFGGTRISGLSPYGFGPAPEGVDPEIWEQADDAAKVAFLEAAGMLPPGTEDAYRQFLTDYPEATDLLPREQLFIASFPTYPTPEGASPQERFIYTGSRLGNVMVRDLIAQLKTREGKQWLHTMPEQQLRMLLNTRSAGHWESRADKPVKHITVEGKGEQQPVYGFPLLANINLPKFGGQAPSEKARWGVYPRDWGAWAGQEEKKRKETREKALYMRNIRLGYPEQVAQKTLQPTPLSWGRLAPPARWLTF